MSSVVDAPRERVFDYLADIANHAEFTDHFIKEFRLERIESRGAGAGARFRARCGLGWVWADAVLTEVERPFRIRADGRAGRIGRVPISAEYKLTHHERGMTRVELTFESKPATATDRLRESLGARSLLTYALARALRRMRLVLEQGEPSTHAARVAAG